MADESKEEKPTEAGKTADTEGRQHELAKWGIYVSIITAVLGTVTSIGVAIIQNGDDDDEVAIVSEPGELEGPTGVGTSTEPPGDPALSSIFNRQVEWGMSEDTVSRRGFVVGAPVRGCACPSGRTYAVRPISGSMGVIRGQTGTATFYSGRGLVEIVVTLDSSLDTARTALRGALGLGGDTLMSGSTPIGPGRIRVAANTLGANVVRIWHPAEWDGMSADCGARLATCP